MAAIAERVIRRIGLDNSPFNIEFFWDKAHNRVWLLEINPRISQSHGDLFEKVDGVPHHKVLLDLALGRRPRWRKGAGEFRHAGKFFLRRFQDGVVTRVPTHEEIRAIHREVPGTLVEVNVQEGRCLSGLAFQEQDSYSYIYAMLFIGADSRRRLMEKYQRCRDMLWFEFAGNETVAPPSASASRRGNVPTRDTEHTS
jgi:biotin carboxylase